jgi:hypothetical protein
MVQWLQIIYIELSGVQKKVFTADIVSLIATSWGYYVTFCRASANSG